MKAKYWPLPLNPQTPVPHPLRIKSTVFLRASPPTDPPSLGHLQDSSLSGMAWPTLPNLSPPKLAPRTLYSAKLPHALCSPPPACPPWKAAPRRLGVAHGVFLVGEDALAACALQDTQHQGAPCALPHTSLLPQARGQCPLQGLRDGCLSGPGPARSLTGILKASTETWFSMESKEGRRAPDEE